MFQLMPAVRVYNSCHCILYVYHPSGAITNCAWIICLMSSLTVSLGKQERSDEELGLASVFGGARATQEADNVLIMQVLRSGDTQRKYIQVWRPPDPVAVVMWDAVQYVLSFKNVHIVS